MDRMVGRGRHARYLACRRSAASPRRGAEIFGRAGRAHQAEREFRRLTEGEIVRRGRGDGDAKREAIRDWAQLQVGRRQQREPSVSACLLWPRCRSSILGHPRKPRDGRLRPTRPFRASGSHRRSWGVCILTGRSAETVTVLVCGYDVAGSSLTTPARSLGARLGCAVVIVASGGTGMTVHHARVIPLAAVLVGLAALSPYPRVQAQQPVSELPLDELRALAEQGDAEAQFNLGLIYHDGQGVPEDYAEAVRWWRLAADQGDAVAQFNLGGMYRVGAGVPQDYVEAHMWLNLAASRSSGDERDEVVEVRDWVAQRLTSDQISEAQRFAREWEAANSTPNEDAIPPGSTDGTGTAFIVDPDGLLLTAHHVIDQATSISVSCNARPPVPARVTSSSATTDLALLEVSGDLGTESFLRLSPQRVSSLGDRVFTIGYPMPSLLGTDPKYTDGTVSALFGPGGDASFLQISVPVQPGNSGGPLVNDEGDVVGVVVASAAAPAFFQATGNLPQNINWAVKSVYASALFEPPRAGATPAAEGDDVIERVTEATCLVRTTVPVQ